MELEENNAPEEHEGDYVEIYSSRAIFWFSVLASPIFGGVLLAYNLKAAGYKKALYIVGVFTVLYTVITSIAISQYITLNKINLNIDFASKNVDPKFLNLGFMSLGIKIACGLIFTQYFFKKYFPEDDYYPKSILPAFLATVFASLVLGYLSALLQIRII